MIIIEGMDNSGKSTLAAQLARDLHALLLNHRGMPLGNRDEYQAYIMEVAQLRIPMVIDRFPLLSEPIYGPICRGTHIFSPEDLISGWRYLMTHQQHVVIVHCRPPKNIILGTLTEREQMDGVDRHKEELIDTYDKYFNELYRSPLEVYLYDYTLGNYDKILQNLRGKA